MSISHTQKLCFHQTLYPKFNNGVDTFNDFQLRFQRALVYLRFCPLKLYVIPPYVRGHLYSSEIEIPCIVCQHAQIPHSVRPIQLRIVNIQRCLYFRLSFTNEIFLFRRNSSSTRLWCDVIHRFQRVRKHAASFFRVTFTSKVGTGTYLNKIHSLTSQKTAISTLTATTRTNFIFRVITFTSPTDLTFTAERNVYLLHHCTVTASNVKHNSGFISHE
jgi:hypothetical protein